MKLNVKAFALTAGLFWGIGLFLLTWWAIAIGGPTDDTTFLGRISSASSGVSSTV